LQNANKVPVLFFCDAIQKLYKKDKKQNPNIQEKYAKQK